MLPSIYIVIRTAHIPLTTSKMTITTEKYSSIITRPMSTQKLQDWQNPTKTCSELHDQANQHWSKQNYVYYSSSTNLFSDDYIWGSECQAECYCMSCSNLYWINRVTKLAGPWTCLQAECSLKKKRNNKQIIWGTTAKTNLKKCWEDIQVCRKFVVWYAIGLNKSQPTCITNSCVAIFCLTNKRKKIGWCDLICLY